MVDLKPSTPAPIKSGAGYLPIGVGLRSQHFAEVIEHPPALDWFELLADNHINSGGKPLYEAQSIAEKFPISLHSVGLSIGSSDPLNKAYMAELKKIADLTNPWIMSDHLCWTSVHGQHAHDLLPLPYTEETVKYASQRIRQIQDYFERPMAIENVSTYLNFKDSTMTEGEFVAAVANEADCYILFDINNVYVSHINNGTDVDDYFKKIPAERIVEIHLAGFEDCGEYLIDAHNNPVHPKVWEMYAQFIQANHYIPTLIEWDNDIPSFEILFNEAKYARSLCQAQ